MRIKVSNLDEMNEFGRALGRALKSKDIVCLDGDLGAGKTTLTKSIGLGLGVDDYITSPTFALLNEYKGNYDLYHFDVYRIEHIEELYELGFEDYFYGEGISIIEWASLIRDVLPKDVIEVYIEKTDDINERIINIKSESKRYEEILKEMNL